MKAVLFAYANFEGGGLETRIAGQVDFYHRQGIKCYLACLSCADQYRPLFDEVLDGIYFAQPYKNVVACCDILKDADTLARFCQEHSVDYIDCHPFWCVFPVALAARQVNIPAVYTAHGTTSLDFIDPAFPVGQSFFRLVLEHGFAQIFTVAEYLQGLHPEFTGVQIARNGLQEPPPSSLPEPHVPTYRYALASRLDAAKTKLIIDALPTLLGTQIEKIDIYGAGDHQKDLQKFIKDHGYAGRVKLKGWSGDFLATLEASTYDGVIGMGRVVLEAAALDLPALVLGYGGLAGFITKDNFATFRGDNFTSFSSRISKTELAKQLSARYRDDTPFRLRQTVSKELDPDQLWQNYLDQISALSYRPTPLIEAFFRVLQSAGDRNLLADAALPVELATELSNQISAMETSASWKLTQPLRKANAKLGSLRQRQ